MQLKQAHFPGRAPIEAYGNGGFRFADMSHKGSILVLPSGIYGWDVTAPEGLCVAAFERICDETPAPELLLLGTGKRLVPPAREVRETLGACGIRLELMDTGAAARTYNVLLAEQRAVAAALIAVE